MSFYQSDDEIEDDYNDDFDDDNDPPVSTCRTSPIQRTFSQPRFKSRNGKHKINMTPPDEKMAQSEKLARKYKDEGKVCRYFIFDHNFFKWLISYNILGNSKIKR